MLESVILLTYTEARRTFKAVLSAPKIVPPPGAGEVAEEAKADVDGDVAMAEAAEVASPAKPAKRSAAGDVASSKKKVKSVK